MCDILCALGRKTRGGDEKERKKEKEKENVFEGAQEKKEAVTYQADISHHQY